ncbi:MAG: sigma-70 family RNA polymerase sigma factor [Deltaproteobacteria bacterium]|nr:MAG: sigma-70 family RNA polymerase sigma factor [Deltaproteobacteria bacterium]
MMRATRGGMMSSGSEDAGQGAQGNGASDSTDALLPLLYQELKAIARRERLRLSGGETLATTALLHEAYARLAPAHGFPSRGQFLASAAVTMRRILIDRVRAQLAAKRGAGAEQVGLDEAADFVVEDGATVLGVHDALERLHAVNPRLVKVVECRFFAGYSELETGEALGISERTVQRDWATARAWLKKEMGR